MESIQRFPINDLNYAENPIDESELTHNMTLLDGSVDGEVVLHIDFNPIIRGSETYYPKAVIHSIVGGTIVPSLPAIYPNQSDMTITIGNVVGTLIVTIEPVVGNSTWSTFLLSSDIIDGFTPEKVTELPTQGGGTADYRSYYNDVPSVNQPYAWTSDEADAPKIFVE